MNTLTRLTILATPITVLLLTFAGGRTLGRDSARNPEHPTTQLKLQEVSSGEHPQRLALIATAIVITVLFVPGAKSLGYDWTWRSFADTRPFGRDYSPTYSDGLT